MTTNWKVAARASAITLALAALFSLTVIFAYWFVGILPVEGEILQKSTAAQYVIIGQVVSSATPTVPVTSLTITQAMTWISKNGAAATTKHDATSAVHLKNGYYTIKLDDTDANTAGNVFVTLKLGSPYLECSAKAVVMATAQYAGAVSGTTKMPVNVTQIEGADPTDTIRDSVVDDATRIDGSRVNGCSTHSATDVAALILATPAQKLVTDANGRVDLGAVIGHTFGTHVGHNFDVFFDNGNVDSTVTQGSVSIHTAAQVAALILADPTHLLYTEHTTGYVGLANIAHGGNATTITLQTPIVANVTQIIAHAFGTHVGHNFDVFFDNGNTDSTVTQGSLTGFSTFNSATDKVYLGNGAHGGNLATFQVAITGNITGNLSGSVDSVTHNVGGNVTGSVGSLVTWDKAGYSLSATGADLITKTSTFALAMADAQWDESMVGHTTAGTAGKLLQDAGSVSAASIWGTLTNTFTTTGSIGKLLKDDVNATIGSRATKADVKIIIGP